MAEELKTVKITATMHTDLELTINVPKDMPTDRVYQLAREGHIDGGELVEPEGMSGDWTWGEVYELDFDDSADARFDDCPSWMED